MWLSFDSTDDQSYKNETQVVINHSWLRIILWQSYVTTVVPSIGRQIRKRSHGVVFRGRGQCILWFSLEDLLVEDKRTSLWSSRHSVHLFIQCFMCGHFHSRAFHFPQRGGIQTQCDHRGWSRCILTIYPPVFYCENQLQNYPPTLGPQSKLW